MEQLALDRAAAQELALRGIQLVDAGRQERLDARRHEDLVAASLTQQREHLLDEERVSLRGGSDPDAQIRLELLAVQEVVDELVDLARRERLERDGDRVASPRAPARTQLEQLRPRETDQHERRSGREVRHVLDELDERRLAPLHVVEHDYERLLVRARLEQLAYRPADLLGHRRHLRLTE